MSLRVLCYNVNYHKGEYMPPRKDKVIEKTTVMSVRIPEHWVAMLSTMADRKGITRNTLLKRIIARTVQRVSKEVQG